MTPTRKLWTWVAVLVAIAIVSCVSCLFASEMPPTPLAKPTLVGIVAAPLFDQNGVLESMHVTANFRIVGLRPDGRTLTYQIVPVSFDLIQQGGQTVVLGNSIVDFRDIGTDLVGVAEFVWRTKNPPPEPVRRKMLREVGTAK